MIQRSGLLFVEAVLDQIAFAVEGENGVPPLQKCDPRANVLSNANSVRRFDLILEGQS